MPSPMVASSIAICTFCGSLSPTVPAAFCAHPEAATLSELRPEVVDMLTRIRRIRNSLSGALDAFRELVQLELHAGRATVEKDPTIHAAGLANVTFLRPRNEWVHP